MIKGPCKGCPERDAPDCRIMCPAWLEYQAKLAAEREAKIRARDAENDYWGSRHTKRGER